MDQLERQEWLERLLSGLESFWAEVPQVAGEIDSWGLDDRLMYTEDTAQLVHVHRENIERHLADLTDDQKRRFEAVLKLIEKNQVFYDEIMNTP